MIEKLKNNKYKFNDLILYEEVVIKHNLLYKKEVSNLDEIIKDNYYYEIYNVSLKYINKKIRSHEELKVYLLNKDYDINIIESVLSKLKSINVLNDELYCKSYINDKLYLTKYGIGKIKNDLLNQKINIDLIDKSITSEMIEYSDNKFNKLLDKYIKAHKNKSKNELRNKVFTYFINLGYDYEVIKEKFNLFEIKVSSVDIKKEYDKLYKKYKNKYKGYELDNYIKNRMYQKGFSFEEIDNAKKNQ